MGGIALFFHKPTHMAPVSPGAMARGPSLLEGSWGRSLRRPRRHSRAGRERVVRAAAELEQGSAIGAVQGAAGHAQCPSGQGGRRWCPREQKPNGHGPRRRRHSHWYGLREVPSLNPMDSCEENIKQEAHSRYSVPFRAAVAGTQVSDSGSHRQAQGTDSQGSLVRASLGPAPLVIVKAEAWQTLLLPRVRPQATDRASGRPPAQAVCPLPVWVWERSQCSVWLPSATPGPPGSSQAPAPS